MVSRRSTNEGATMTTPDSHIPNSNAYPSGGNRGVQSYVPAPQGVPQAGVPAQPRCRTLSSGSLPCVQPTSPIISILEILFGETTSAPRDDEGTPLCRMDSDLSLRHRLRVRTLSPAIRRVSRCARPIPRPSHARRSRVESPHGSSRSSPSWALLPSCTPLARCVMPVGLGESASLPQW